jgi:hypothetical protein
LRKKVFILTTFVWQMSNWAASHTKIDPTARPWSGQEGDLEIFRNFRPAPANCRKLPSTAERCRQLPKKMPSTAGKCRQLPNRRQLLKKNAVNGRTQGPGTAGVGCNMPKQGKDGDGCVCVYMYIHL